MKEGQVISSSRSKRGKTLCKGAGGPVGEEVTLGKPTIHSVRVNTKKGKREHSEDARAR